jgi:16S rRNA (cytosine1402-N4)-methyltransferase
LVKIIQEFGQDRQAKKIARAIVVYRKKSLITTTMQLADVIKEAVLGKNGSWLTGQRHPALRTFQALRIYINQELKELSAGLRAAEMCLKPKGRAAIVSFHSLEDRIVKRFFLPTPVGLQDQNWRNKAKWTKMDTEEDISSFEGKWENQDLRLLDYSHLIPTEEEDPLTPFRVLSRKVIKPTQEEVLENPRARSAKLRIAERTSYVCLD